MAFDVLDEYEQGEVVRQWVRDNAVSMVVGVVAGLALIFGWQQWKAHEGRTRVDAAAQYASFDRAVSANTPDDADKIAAALREHYAGSPYAVFASLRQADAQSARDDLAGAETSLKWAVEHADSPSLKALATLNLARVRLAEDKPEDAQKLIGAVSQDEYPAIRNELLGDVLVQLKQPDAARTAYESALATLDPQSPERSVLQMKLDDQAVVGAPAAAATPPVTPAATPTTTPESTPDAPAASKPVSGKGNS